MEGIFGMFKKKVVDPNSPEAMAQKAKEDLAARNDKKPDEARDPMDTLKDTRI